MRFQLISILFSAFLLLGSESLVAQEPVHDLTTIDGIVKECLRLVSRKEGELMDTAGFRNLFLPNAVMVQMSDFQDGRKGRIIKVNELVKTAGSKPANVSFEETELKIEVDQYNGIAHVWQSYKAYHGKEVRTGINSYQLVFQDGRWWIAHLMWSSDLNGVKVPNKYMPTKGK